MKDFKKEIEIDFITVENQFESELQADIFIPENIFLEINLFNVTTVFNKLTTPLVDGFLIKSNNIKIENKNYLRIFIQKEEKEGVDIDFKNIDLIKLKKQLELIVLFAVSFSFYREKINFYISINKNIKIEDKPKIHSEYLKYKEIKSDNKLEINENLNFFTEIHYIDLISLIEDKTTKQKFIKLMKEFF